MREHSTKRDRPQLTGIQIFLRIIAVLSIIFFAYGYAIGFHYSIPDKLHRQLIVEIENASGAEIFLLKSAHPDLDRDSQNESSGRALPIELAGKDILHVLEIFQKKGDCRVRFSDIIAINPDVLLKIRHRDERVLDVHISLNKNTFVFQGSGILWLPQDWRKPLRDFVENKIKSRETGSRETGADDKKEKTSDRVTD